MTGRRPVSVAVTGGIGAGKSELLRAFERRGAPVVSSDEVVHDLIREDAEVRRALLDRWGERIQDDAGEIDRNRIGEIVFSDRSELSWLEALLHPRVAARYLVWREELAHLPEPPALCVAEVPLLYEVGAETRFDAVVAITAAPEIRRSRAGRRLGDRERRLLPEEDKLARADFAYVNEGSLEELDAFAAGVVVELLREAEKVV